MTKGRHTYIILFIVAFSLWEATKAQNITLTIAVVGMTEAHPQYTNPRHYAAGYTVNGIEGAPIRLLPGTTYRFNVTNSCSHPFYITTDANGGPADFFNDTILPGTHGITLYAPNGTVLPTNFTGYKQLCGGAYMDWTPSGFDIGAVWYYQCAYHDAMGWTVSIGQTSATADHTVTVQEMTTSHPQYNNPLRVSTGYSVNGIEGAALTFSALKPYRIRAQGSCNHPLYLTLSRNGGGTDFPAGALAPGTHGIELLDRNGALLSNVSDYLQICNGGAIEITPPLTDVGLTYYYQCAFHDAMGWNITIVGQTICEKYSGTLGQVVFMDTLVTKILENIFAEPLLLPFFNASYSQRTSPPCCTINYLNTTSEYLRLKKMFTEFFGSVLGCNDPGFPQYSGSTNMRAVHSLMPITPAEFNKFNSIVESTVLSNGVDPSDYATLGAFLESTRSDICNSGACGTSFCDRYSHAVGVSSAQFLKIVVTETVEKLVDPLSMVKQYFNGGKPAGSTDFTNRANSAKYDSLVDHLAQFLGQKGFFSCSDPSFPSYAGTTELGTLHQAMRISGSEFDYFNQALLEVLKGKGVTRVDQEYALSVLESTRSLIVSQADTTPVPIQSNFTFVVAPKNMSHPQFNVGYDQGYYPSAPISVQFGKSYAFTFPGSCAHLLYLTTSSAGGEGVGGASEVTDGISSNDYSLVCNGSSFILAVDQLFCNQIGNNKVYYNCRIHSSMGGPITVSGCPDPSQSDQTSGVIAGLLPWHIGLIAGGVLVVIIVVVVIVICITKKQESSDTAYWAM